MDFNSGLLSAAKEIGVDISDSQCEKFNIYMNELLSWNEKINLTAITKPEEIIIKHFIDSLTCVKYISEGTKLIDVGTGAGFPGIPLKIFFEDQIDVLLLDSLNKRINFLNEVIMKLDLRGISAVHGRAEEAAVKALYREKYDIVTARAVANLSTLSEYCLPFVKVGGKMLAMKGGDTEKEVKEAQRAVSVLGGEIINVETIILPATDIKHSIVEIKKVKNTPKEYPRKAGKPEKDPIR